MIATEREKPKRRRPQVWANPCPECTSDSTRVTGTKRVGIRQCRCEVCGATWQQLPTSPRMDRSEP